MKAVTSLSLEPDVLIYARHKYGRMFSQKVNELLKIDLNIKEISPNDMTILENEIALLQTRLSILEEKKITLAEKKENEQRRIDEANEEGKRRALRVQ